MKQFTKESLNLEESAINHENGEQVANEMWNRDPAWNFSFLSR
jgi:hypothetical protein